MKFTPMTNQAPPFTHLTGGALHGIPAFPIAWKAVSLIAIMSAVVSSAAPVKWDQPLAGNSQRRLMVHEEIMAPEVLPAHGKDTVPDVCRTGVHLEWSTRVGSSVFAAPRIVDLNHDGSKEILVPTYTQYLEALDGANGEDVSGFPFMHPKFKSYASPLPIDIDGDGKTEWLVAMYTGELMVFDDSGKALLARKVPPLPVKKNWVEKKLSGDDAVSFNMKKVIKSEEELRRIFAARRMQDLTFHMHHVRSAQYRNGSKKEKSVAPGGPTAATVSHRTLAETRDHEDLAGLNAAPVAVNDERINNKNDEDDDDDDMEFEFDEPFNPFEETYDDSVITPRSIGADGKLSAEGRASMDLLYHQELYKSGLNYKEEEDAFHFRNKRYTDEVLVADDEVAVDPHILSTPVLADVDGNGDLDIVLHISYYYDPRAYEGDQENLLPSGIDIDDYLADALMVLNMVTGEVKWLKVLHLTRKNSTTPAYALSTPIVINSGNDAQQEIFVTTTAGAIFGFTGKGSQIQGWPVWMEYPITGGVSAEDVDADGVLDFCAGDTGGRVACYTAKGEKKWGRQFSGAITDHITFGDIDGDGNMDLAFGTTSGLLYVVRGHDGVTLPVFPVATGGPILAPPLPVNLNTTLPPRNQNGKGLHLVVPSHDGVLYIVSGTTGCVDTIDIGEKSSTPVLADDITGNGKLDLVVGTLSGSIIVFETMAEFHPLKVWTSKTKSTNGLTASEGHVGVFIHPSSRVARDVRGDIFTLLVTIYDNRAAKLSKRWYNLVITIGPRIIVHRKLYEKPGTYTIMLHTPLERMYASVTVMMLLPNGQKYEDSVALSFNMHFLETIKFTFLLPFLMACLAISFVSRRHEVDPPRMDSLDF